MDLGFALEYSLGHSTHADNLKAVLAARPELRPFYVDLPYDDLRAPWKRLPGVRSNWSLRASLGARLGLRRARGLRGALFHTQVTALLSAGFMRRVPSVVSLDATPLQYDALGAFYNHASGGGATEDLKKRLNQRAFAAAGRLVSWSQWAKDSLVADYGVPADKIEVIPPGIDVARWDFAPRPLDKPNLDLLFVGGDFPRKGGDTLLAAYDHLPEPVRRRTCLHLVTKSESVAEREGVRVYRGVTANSPTLLELFRQADAFVFPTRGDCLPVAILEALAAGLPVITTAVAALPEAVVDGVSGRIVPVDDADALAGAITELADDPRMRQRMGQAARAAARERFDAARNYGRLIETVRAGAK